MLALIIFLIFNFISRAILYSFAVYQHEIDLSLLEALKAFSFGLINDVITSFYIIALLSLFRLIIPNKIFYSKINSYIYSLIYFAVIFALCFLIASEFTFWLEFSTRFNFIAVDYLVYTQEVIGNIKESYPMHIIIPIIFIIASIFFFILKPVIKYFFQQPIDLKSKAYNFLTYLFICIVSYNFYNPKLTDIKENNYLNEISKNGLYNLFSAFLNNSLDYYQFYKSKDDEESLADLGKMISEKGSLTRMVQPQSPEKNYNVILITIESLSAHFIGSIYEGKELTPNLSKLINESIYFDNFFATGTRTVRGLEAITLGLPPIPGQSILRRKNNENLYSIGSVLNNNGYESKFIYGGYGYFDNMNYFFAHNGFKTIDRKDVPANEVEFENIWGISDEDLYKQVLKEADQSFNNKKKFFSLVMTTSNHRPFTFPQGRIDIASKLNREGGVKYTDYALGKFLQSASTKPWFNNTIFVITADHCAGSAGKVALPPQKYHIPLLIYAPKIIEPKVVHKMASQIDLAPTILGLLNISYESKFFGNDIFSKKYENAFISTYQKLGLMADGKLTVLSPIKAAQTYQILDNFKLEETELDQNQVNQAINYYQSAYYLFTNGKLKVVNEK